MAADSTYERQMLGGGSRTMLDLGQLQDNFHALLAQAHPDHISAFFYWLDLKVAQFKVFGNCLTQGNNFCSPQKQQHHDGIPGENSAVHGSLYTTERAQPHGLYIKSEDQQNGLSSEERYAGVDGMPSLCSVQELDVSNTQSEDSNAKQVVKSLLRAMLAKPRPGDIPSLMELTARNEFDSGSDGDALEQSLGADGKDDDSQSAADAVARDDGAMIKSETDLPASTGHNWTSSSAGPSPEKASRCPYCLKMFRYRSSYRRHVKIHEGIFSHECTVCMRKFTRKEHFLRHKCDRRPNKPYNVTNEAFRRMTASEKAAARQLVKSALQRDALTHLSLAGFDGEQAETPLELTCQSAGKQADAPKLLFSGGTMSSMPARSLHCITYPSITSTDTSSGPGAQSLENVTPRAMDTSSLMNEENVAPRAMDVTSLMSSENVAPRAMDATSLIHNESRRKSSTPRKVVTVGLESNGSTTELERTIVSESCRLNFPAGRLGNVPVSVIE